MATKRELEQRVKELEEQRRCKVVGDTAKREREYHIEQSERRWDFRSDVRDAQYWDRLTDEDWVLIIEIARNLSVALYQRFGIRVDPIDPLK